MPYKVQVPLAAINGGADYAILVGKDEMFPWENGHRVSDVPIGVKLKLLLQNGRMEPLTVKFPSDPLPKITDEAIAEACSACRFLFVKVPDCNVDLRSENKPNSTVNGIGMSATAQTAQIVPAPKE